MQWKGRAIEGTRGRKKQERPREQEQDQAGERTPGESARELKTVMLEPQRRFSAICAQRKRSQKKLPGAEDEEPMGDRIMSSLAHATAAAAVESN
ncbi:hypothetical protein R1flu_027693 [Riccia fluitans]|uniref:Uncharacterized protein n=1 Tax=Riccia fluitans TaxID=41844 RepID=A0ABD1XJN0_9MARC